MKCWPNAGIAGQQWWQRTTQSLWHTRWRPARSDALHQLAVITRGPSTYRLPLRHRWWPQRRLVVACTPPDTLPLPCVPYEREHNSPAAQRRRSGPSVDLYTGVKFWSFLMSKEWDRLICGSTYMRVYMVHGGSIGSTVHNWFNCWTWRITSTYQHHFDTIITVNAYLYISTDNTWLDPPRWLRWLRHSAHRPRRSIVGAGIQFPGLAGRVCVLISRAHALRMRLISWAGKEGSTVTSIICDCWLILG